MADVFNFYVRDNRKINFEIAEPIMREDSGVTDFVFHIPKSINNLDMSDWAWWFVFVNANKEKYSIALTLSDDPERPLEYNLATYTVDYAMSIKAGTVQFALEAINTGTGGVIDNEWHTLTYETKVKETLQGNQAEYAETESDIISALLEEVRTKVNQLVGGATPEPKNLVADMTDPKKVYLYVGSEPNEHAGHWYYYNGSAWVSGGLYSAGIVDSVPTQGSTNAVSSGGVYSALQDKAPAIIAESESGYNHTDANITSVKFYGGAYAWKNARYANKKNYLPALSGSKTTYGVTFTFANGFLIYNGTSTGNGTYDVGYIVDVEIPAGTYTILCEIHKGETTITTGRVPTITVTYEDDTTENVTLPSATYTDVSGTVTFAKAVKRMNIKAGLRSGNVYSDYRMWYGVYPSDVHIVDTENTVADGEVYTTSITNIPIVNTMQHASKVVALADTKEYVDNHLPSYDFDEIVYSRDHYLSPEMYGAIGDGTTDDTTAVLACIAAAKTNNKSVRGYGNYAISSPIEISGENADIFLKRINYSGSDCAVKISGINHNLKFGVIMALQSNAKGIVFWTANSVYTNAMNVECTYLYSNSHGFYFYNTDGSDDDGNSYVMSGIHLISAKVRSYAGSIFYAVTGVAELTCNFGNIRNLSGFAFYLKYGNIYVAEANMEECYAGFLAYKGGYRIGAVRAGEMVNQMRADAQDATKGLLFSCESGGFGYIILTDVFGATDFVAIDVSSRKSTRPSSNDNYEYKVDAGRIRRYYNYYYLPDGVSQYNGNMTVYGKAAIYGNRKAFIPDQKTALTISDDINLGDMQHLLPYRFNITASDVTILLDDSYCPYGIDEIVVDTTATGSSCTIYDSDNNVVFDSAMYNSGIYRVRMMQNNPVNSVSTVWGWVVGDPLDYIVEKLTITTS